jgi:hypothetical protein
MLDVARLTTRARKSLGKSQFALPGKGEGPQGKGARVSQHGSSAEKAAVRAKVRKRYPSIKVGDEED